MEDPEKSIFREKYRVVSVESDRLLVRGVLSGEILTIINPVPGRPLTQEEYPPGKLIALSDPATEPLNSEPADHRKWTELPTQSARHFRFLILFAVRFAA